MSKAREGKLVLARSSKQFVDLFDAEGRHIARVCVESFQTVRGTKEAKVSFTCPRDIQILRGELCQR